MLGYKLLGTPLSDESQNKLEELASAKSASQALPSISACCSHVRKLDLRPWKCRLLSICLLLVEHRRQEYFPSDLRVSLAAAGEKLHVHKVEDVKVLHQLAFTLHDIILSIMSLDESGWIKGAHGVGQERHADVVTAIDSPFPPNIASRRPLRCIALLSA